MTFKDVLANDRSVFINIDEFADRHMIGDKEISCLIDSNELLSRQQGRYLEGTYTSQILLYVRTEDLPRVPSEGDVMILDKKRYLVKEVSNECGILAITLDVVRVR